MKSKLLFSLVLVLFLCGCDGQVICTHKGSNGFVSHGFNNWAINTNLQFMWSNRPVTERTCQYCGMKDYND